MVTVVDQLPNLLSLGKYLLVVEIVFIWLLTVVHVVLVVTIESGAGTTTVP